jgi:hypothetical protein
VGTKPQQAGRQQGAELTQVRGEVEVGVGLIMFDRPDRAVESVRTVKTVTWRRSAKN